MPLLSGLKGNIFDDFERKKIKRHELSLIRTIMGVYRKVCFGYMIVMRQAKRRHYIIKTTTEKENNNGI
jgi:hypothetical protein